MASKETIDNIGKQVGRLIDEHRKVTRQRNALADECKSLREENRSLQEQIKSLKAELSLARLSSGFGGDEHNRKQARARINRLLREVDRCIALAGNIE